MQSIYVDGLANATLIDGVVRLELIALTQVDNSKPVSKSVGSLAISLPGLLRVQDQIGRVVDEMVKKGVLKREPVEQISK